MQCQSPATFPAPISVRIHSPLSQVFRPACAAAQLVAVRFRIAPRRCPFRQRLAETAAANGLEEHLEIRIPVAVASACEMKMIVAQFMLDDFLHLFRPVNIQLMGIDFNMMTFHKIPPACRGQPAVEGCFMSKGQPKALERNPLHPSLQLLVAHLLHCVHHIPFCPARGYKCYLNFNFPLGYTVK